METVVSKISGILEEDMNIYHQASGILKDGGLVAFPTETVYGLGASALNEEAVKKIYTAKGRPSDNPLIVHISEISALYELSREVNEKALKLAEKFWPGPLTIILKKKEIVPEAVTGGLDTVAVRMPDHPTARNLIRESGLYIAAPSANASGKPSPTRARHVMRDLDGKINMIIEDDTVNIGIESTIVDLSEETPVILRPGSVTEEMLKSVLGNVYTDKAVFGQEEALLRPRAPGMKYRHYAPDAELTIVKGEETGVISKINELVKEKTEVGLSAGIMTTDENSMHYAKGIVRSMGTRKDEASIARHLYEILREFDELQVDVIYSESFSGEHVGQAIMNRLLKASGHRIIYIEQ